MEVQNHPRAADGSGHLSSCDSMCNRAAENELQSRGGAETKLDFSFAASRIDFPTCAAQGS